VSSKNSPRRQRTPVRLRWVRAALNAGCAAFIAAAFVWGASLYRQGTPPVSPAPSPKKPPPSSVRLTETGVPLAQPDKRASPSAKPSPSPVQTQGETPPPASDALVECALKIPSLSLELPISEVCTEETLLRYVCKFSGPQPGQEGNYVVAGHDFLSGAQFARLPEMRPGDKVIIRNRENREYTYTVYALQLVTPEDVQSLTVPEKAKEATLLTCARQNTMRLLVRCRLD
jgi:LPXTG-site transpeptidase (sortase) family protein